MHLNKISLNQLCFKQSSRLSNRALVNKSYLMLFHIIWLLESSWCWLNPRKGFLVAWIPVKIHGCSVPKIGLSGRLGARRFGHHPAQAKIGLLHASLGLKLLQFFLEVKKNFKNTGRLGVLGARRPGHVRPTPSAFCNIDWLTVIARH